MERKRILVVDDEENLCEILKFNLEKAGYGVDTALSAEEALSMDLSVYCLLIIDIMMGDISGIQMAGIVKKNRSLASLPIIFCTARGSEDDIVSGLNLGADDYIAKPFSIKEVLARIEAVLRRSGGGGGVYGQDGETLRYDGLTLDRVSKKVFVDDADTSLTKKEFEILHLLLQKPGRVFSREELLKTVWPDDVFVTDRTVDVHITRLRKKITPYDRNIVARLGYGYCFEM
ncbi:MAG: response regulator transcription factor [Tannerella sp.]|jgi:DNA-binding response OmpR family regulator|nr:response regulator transcription factor [Tannerella sp.]